MKRRAIVIRCSVLAALVCLLASGGARAQSCVNDVDCPNAACGGEVCDYSTGSPTCKAAGSQPKGMDGWCTQDSDCKCASLGAKCDQSLVFCTFTKPSDAPGAGNGGHGGSGSAGATGTGGSSVGSGGATGAGGSSTQGTGGAGAAGHAGSSDGGSSGGCSIAGASTSSEALGCAFLASFGLAAVILRRRRAAP